jgi:hypothetical protein
MIVQLIKDIERNGRIIKEGSEIEIRPDLCREYAEAGYIRMDNGKPVIIPPPEIIKIAKDIKRSNKIKVKQSN